MIVLVPRDSAIGLVVGPLLWGGYFVLAYAISGVACSLGLGQAQWAGLSVLQWSILLVGAIAAALVATAGIQANRGRQRLRDAAVRGEADARRQGFLYTAAAILCGLSLVGTIWLAMAAAIGPVC